MMREPFPIPDTISIDPVSGYALNIPLGLQVLPSWRTVNAGAYENYMATRLKRGIHVDDDLWPKTDASKYDPSEPPKDKTPRKQSTRMPKRMVKK